MDLHLILGDKNYSSWSMRPWVALTAAGIPFRESTIELDTPDFAAATTRFSPTGAVPILLHDSFAVWDSLAICEYANELCGDRGIWPSAMRERARARSLCAEMHSGFAALRRELPMNIRRSRPKTSGLGDAAREDVARIEGIFAAAHGPFLFGSFGAADAFFAPVVTRLRSYRVEVGDATAAYSERVLGHPAVAAWCDAALAESHELPDYDGLD